MSATSSENIRLPDKFVEEIRLSRGLETPREETCSRDAAWPVIDPAAFYGLAGDVVHTIEPHSEADPVALLVQFLTMAGNVIGRSSYYLVEATRHRANLYNVLVGTSSKARKGTSQDRIAEIVKLADQEWADNKIQSGLSSGEGFIFQVRDAVQKFDAKAGQTEIIDPGVSDKRLMIVEPEFASALSVAERHGNNLSPIVRKAWDGVKLQTLTKNSPLCATNAHVSIVGHITVDELRARLSRTELASGFANRFLFVLVRRSKVLPFGGNLTDSEILHLGERFRSVVEKVNGIGCVTFGEAAARQWATVYNDLSAEKPGLLGSVIARAEAQVIRLALIYALLDGSDTIDLPHLEAALAVWEYCELSAVYVFGNSLGDPVADEILRALQSRPEGMTRTEISSLFGRNQSSGRIGAALQLLTARNRAYPDTRQTDGRSSEVWFAR
jgi:hypothetical protein